MSTEPTNLDLRVWIKLDKRSYMPIIYTRACNTLIYSRTLMVLSGMPEIGRKTGRHTLSQRPNVSKSFLISRSLWQPMYVTHKLNHGFMCWGDPMLNAGFLLCSRCVAHVSVSSPHAT